MLTNTFKNLLIDFVLRGQPLIITGRSYMLSSYEPDETERPYGLYGNIGGSRVLEAYGWTSTSDPGGYANSDGSSGIIYNPDFRTEYYPSFGVPTSSHGAAFKWLSVYAAINYSSYMDLILKVKLDPPLHQFVAPSTIVGMPHRPRTFAVELLR